MGGRLEHICLALVVLCSALAACNDDDCEELSLDECSKDSACTHIEGSPLDPDKMCKKEYAPAGCQDRGLACGQAFTYAHAPDGVLWEFKDTCIPHDWQPRPAPFNAVDWPGCGEQ